jgi:hypothetical protein
LRSKLPGCDCIDRYFDDLSNPECIFCPFPCKNCKDAKVCTTCVGKYRQGANCACILGYFEIEEYDCQKCEF